MSGGHYNYIQNSVLFEMFPESGLWLQYGFDKRKDYKESIEEARKIDPMEDKDTSELLYDMLCLIKSYDWYVSGDTCEEDYKEDLKFFKNKWLKKKWRDK